MEIAVKKATRATPIAESVWDSHRGRIAELYSQNTLADVISTMSGEYGFEATEKQYKRRIKIWGLDKKVKSHEMEFYLQNPAAVAFTRNNIDDRKVKRFLRRRAAQKKTATTARQAEIHPSPALSQPSPPPTDILGFPMIAHWTSPTDTQLHDLPLAPENTRHLLFAAEPRHTDQLGLPPVDLETPPTTKHASFGPDNRRHNMNSDRVVTRLEQRRLVGAAPIIDCAEPLDGLARPQATMHQVEMAPPAPKLKERELADVDLPPPTIGMATMLFLVENFVHDKVLFGSKKLVTGPPRLSCLSSVPNASLISLHVLQSWQQFLDILKISPGVVILACIYMLRMLRSGVSCYDPTSRLGTELDLSVGSLIAIRFAQNCSSPSSPFNTSLHVLDFDDQPLRMSTILTSFNMPTEFERRANYSSADRWGLGVSNAEVDVLVHPSFSFRVEKHEWHDWERLYCDIVLNVVSKMSVKWA